MSQQGYLRTCGPGKRIRAPNADFPYANFASCPLKSAPGPRHVALAPGQTVWRRSKRRSATRRMEKSAFSNIQPPAGASVKSPASTSSFGTNCLQMRVPFALPLNIGTDLVQLHRIWQVSRPSSERFARLARRILQPAELQLLTLQHREWQDLSTAPTHRQESARSWLAGRWAAKEAAKKAWGATLLGFEDLRVERVNDDGEIQILCAPLPQGDAEPLEQVARLTISHEGNYAVATVLATPLHESLISELARRKAEAQKRVDGREG